MARSFLLNAARILGTFLFITTICSRIVLAESRVALVIGNGAYKEGSLANPTSDASLISDALTKVGFDVIQATDVGSSKMSELIREFSQRLKNPNTVGFFYYSGHGVQIDGRNYMVPVDAEIRDEFDVVNVGISTDSVLTRMRLAGSRPNFLILDACRNNPFARRVRSGISKGLAKMDAPPETLIAYATSPGNIADDGPSGEYSPFTKVLARELVQPGLAILMFNRVTRKVYEATRGEQQPFIESSLFPEGFALVSSPSSDVPNRQTDAPSSRPSPRILSFTAQPGNILQGQSSMLRWSTEHASRVRVSGQRALSSKNEPSGSQLVSPRFSQTYVLVAENDEGKRAESSARVQVDVPCWGIEPKLSLRSRPGAFRREEVQRAITGYGFREHDWNPSGGFDNEFKPYDNVVVDCATRLMWQRFGSESQSWTWNSAPEYIRRINDASFAGFSDWRLPTIEEMASLIEPVKNQRGLFISDEFDARDDFWSADDWITDAGGTPVAWSVSYEYGGVFHGGAKTNRFFVRAVRSLPTP